MNLKVVLTLITVTTFSSCNNEPKESTTATLVIDDSSLNCYQYINKKDTVFLKVINVNGNVTGTLVYDFYEKDKNMGTIGGTIKGNILVADYTFRSEGKISVRQVAFRRNDDSYTEGYGEMEEIGGKLNFKIIDSLNFDHSITLNKTDCKNNPEVK